MENSGPRASGVSSFYDVATDMQNLTPPVPVPASAQAPVSRSQNGSSRRSNASTLNESRQEKEAIDVDSEKDRALSPDAENPNIPDIEKQKTTDTTHRRSSVALDVLSRIETADQYHPIHWPAWKKWLIVSIYCLLQIFVTLTSTTYVSVEYLIQAKFGGSTQAVTLGQSMFIVGTAVGPAFLGPLSDIGGRKWVYVVSILLYAILNIGTALAYNLPMLIIFNFLIGVAGSTALSNVAGTIADLFGDSDGAGQPMALFVASANIGPSIGSPIGEWIGDNGSMGWRWIYYINIIIGGVYAFCLCFMPETLPRIVISRAAKKKGSVDKDAVDAAMGNDEVKVVHELTFVATMALKIMLTEPIVIFLALYNGFAYGLLFLYLDGVFEVFSVNNGLSYVGASLTYLNFCVGKHNPPPNFSRRFPVPPVPKLG